jgi:hypothetical protein
MKQAKLESPKSDSGFGFDEMYGGHWLAPDDVEKPFTTTIESWKRQSFANPGGSKDKLVLTLHDVRKPVVLNVTNARNLAAKYGKVPDYWIGKAVLVQVEATSYAGKPTRGIRLYPAES